MLSSQDLWRIVADGGRYELYRGELIPMTPVGLEHGRVVARLVRILDEYVSRNRLGAVCTEVGFELFRDPDITLAPDIAFIETSRLPTGAAAKTFVPFPPDLAVEVLSPSDTATETMRKIETYLNAGVQLVWVVDPGTQRVAVYRSLRDVKVLTPEHDLDAEEIIPGFRTKVSAIFGG